MNQASPGQLETATASNRTAIIAEVRQLFLDRMERALRAAGVNAPNSIAALRAGAAQLLDQMTTEGARTGFELANSLTASQIRLVDDNQLELSIRLGDISRRLRDECAPAMHKFHQRFVSLLDRPALRVADDPLSPEAICRALAEMFGAGDVANYVVVERLGEIEGQLVAELPLLYAELAELLVRRQIPAAKLQAVASSPRVPVNRRRGSDGVGDAMAALQQIVQSRQPVAGGVAGGGSGADMAPRFEQVMSQLDQWQSQEQSDLFEAVSAQEVSLGALHALKASEAMARLRTQDTVALDVLSVLFGAIFEDARLAPPVKAAIARMQIPVLKAAILEPNFFSDPEHPARAVLEDMGHATIGLGSDVDGDHPVCIELQRVATGIQKDFRRDPEVFTRYGAELESFIARRHHDLQGSAQDFIALAKVQEEHDVAARTAWRLVASRTLSTAPPAVADFLREHWAKVLADDWLYHGQRGEMWQADERVLDDLLWSIQPKGDADERTRLGRLVPDLLVRLKAGLDRVGVTAEARAPFFDACFSLQAAAIRGRVMPFPTSATPPADAVDTDTVGVMSANGVILKTLRPTNPDARASGDAVHELVIGDWVEFCLPDGSQRCGRLCWVSQELGNPLFMNPGWDCAISVARVILERQFASGQASSGSALSFFDNAVDKALNQSAPAKAS